MKAALWSVLWLKKQYRTWREMEPFSRTVKFLQHPAFPLWEEIGSPAPGGPQLCICAVWWKPPVSADSRQGQLPSLSSSRSLCPLLLHKVIGRRPTWVLSPHLLPTLLSDLTFCYLTSFFSPPRQRDLLWCNLWSSWAAVAHFQLSSQSAVFGSTCLWPLMS